MTESVDGPATDARWFALHDALLRGLSHALSNRIATLSASAYMLEFGDITAEAAAVTLNEETGRMDSLLQLLRLLPGSEEATREAVSVRDVLDQAVALHAHRLDLRDVEVTCQVDGDVPPVWEPPHQLLREVLLLLDAGRHAAFAAASGVTLTLSGDPDRVRLVARSASAPAAATDEVKTLVWPSLAAARRDGR